ncbi:TGF-beta-activated kinase 1 and MAP3K7-binding protein 1 isoform X2 [Protobothrops mucrosquamatus]|uniref:TGF-beta-activated kinase 1 and MAP3K7-binding protein 1 isoform X2 n=1 Tax=Protobothrops mucrosquamatus TaxID=103944 RepID=UPI000775717F|nr:TGF-beta-activated kinase 1 and MAP3K7-binding protein 1 isoform X2 [Protobothrops mucrosquamatus]
MEPGAYGAGKAGGAFDPQTFIRQPHTILRIVSWLFSIVVFGCIVNEGYINHPKSPEEFCIYNRNQNACNYGITVGVLAFLTCLLYLALDVYFPQISSVKDRKKAVLSDIGVSGFWAFLWFVGFCFLADQWRVSKEEDSLLNEGSDAARAAIAFSFFSIFTWEQLSSWTDDLPLCQLSGVGSASNRSYTTDGKGTEIHPLEDNWLKFRSENNCYLYGVFNGYDGNRITNFVGERLSAELLLGQLNAEQDEAEVRRILLQAFDVVERSFLESIDDALAEKASLQSQLPEGVPHHQLPPQYQKILERLKSVEKEISGGAMAIVAVILNNKLYIANVGTNRALLCKSTMDGLQVTQLNMDHTTENEDELFRFSQLGLDAAKIKQVGTIGGQESTRRIGDYKVKYGYSDIEFLSAAKSKPIIAEPEIHGGHPLDGVTGFLVLMSEGLYKALEAAHGPGQANQEIAAMIATEFAKQTSLDSVAQAVVDRVKRIHCDTYASGGERSKFCSRHEDMTVLVRNFGYPLGEMSQPTLTPTQGGRVYPVSVPYSSTQSTSKTSVTLSLVMPSQGQMVNGAHSSSTLDEATPTLTNQSPTMTLQSTNTHTQSSSSSSDGGLFRSRPSHSLRPDEDGRVESYVDFAEFYRLWNMDHSEQGTLIV